MTRESSNFDLFNDITMKKRVKNIIESISEGVFEKEHIISLALLSSIAGESIFLLVTFSVRANVLDLTRNGGWQTLKEFMKHSFKGGTDGEEMLRESMKALDGETFSMADVLVISNFDSVPMRDTLEKLEKQKRKGTWFYGLQIGKWRSEYGGILNRMWHIN